MKRLISILTIFLMLLPQAKAETVTAQGIKTLLNRAVENGKVAEYLIPDATYNNLFVKATDDEVLVGYIKTQDNKDYLHVLAEKKGTNSLTGKLPNATENEVKNLADEVVNAGKTGSYIENLARYKQLFREGKYTELFDELKKTTAFPKMGKTRNISYDDLYKEYNLSPNALPNHCPYMKGRIATNFELEEVGYFVRVYDDSGSLITGKWIFRIEDLRAYKR